MKPSKKNGHIAYFAGGCVRDFILTRPFGDIDIATDALPHEVQALFKKSKAIGQAFGVIQVHHQHCQFEVATFRADSPTGDGRRPDSVVFSDEATDAMRRDFTINALFYDPLKYVVIDYTGGMKDLDRRLLKTVGAAQDRFQEDYLRILRAIRFSHTLNVTLDDDTQDSITKLADRLTQLSIERIHSELSRLFESSPAADAPLIDLIHFGVWDVIMRRVFPETDISLRLSPDKMAHLYGLLKSAGTVPLTELFALFALHLDVPPSPDLMKKAAQNLNFSRKETDLCISLSQNFYPIETLATLDEYDLCKLANQPVFSSLLNLLEASVRFERPVSTCPELTDFRKRSEALQPAPSRWIEGMDLIAAGIEEGPQRKTVSEEAYRKQLMGTFKTKQDALEWVNQQAGHP